MCRILLGLLVDLRLPDNQSPARLISAVRALLDFLYLAQYPVHTSKTLSDLSDALDRFHANKDVFIDLGIRNNFKIPKLHSLQHYVSSIKLFGTTDNYNTQATERLHIDYAKEAYRATNTKDEYPQMILWLERREKIYRHEVYVARRLARDPHVDHMQVPVLECSQFMKMPMHPSLQQVSLETISTAYRATYICDALARFVVATRNPALTAHQVETATLDVFLPFSKLPVFHKIKFYIQQDGESSVVDSIHAHPALPNGKRRRRPCAARFDPALVNTGQGEVTGIQGKLLHLQHLCILLCAHRLASCSSPCYFLTV